MKCKDWIFQFVFFLTCFWICYSGVKIACRLYKAINKAAVVTLPAWRESFWWLGLLVYAVVPLLQFTCLLMFSNAWETWLEDGGWLGSFAILFVVMLFFPLQQTGLQQVSWKKVECFPSDDFSHSFPNLLPLQIPNSVGKCHVKLFLTDQRITVARIKDMAGGEQSQGVWRRKRWNSD